MRHEWTYVVVDGYAADEVDFAARLQASGLQEQVDSKIVGPMANAVDGAVLVIQGHADRIDDPALSHAAALQREAETSQQRADSAANALLSMLGEYLEPAPATWADYPLVGGDKIGCGAARLADHGGSEEAARRNRRVQISLCRFFSDA